MGKRRGHHPFVMAYSCGLFAASAFACSLFLDTNGLGDGAVGPDGAQPNDASLTDVVGDTLTSDTSSPPPDGSTTDAHLPDAASDASPDVVASAVDLVVTGSPAASPISVEATGRFRLSFGSESAWLLTEWVDIGTTSANLSCRYDGGCSANLLLEPFQIQIGGVFYLSREASPSSAQIIDQTPARVQVISKFDLGTGAQKLNVTAAHTIYPSGRVGLKYQANNSNAAAVPIDNVEYMHSTPATNVNWAISAISGSTEAYSRVDGPPPGPNALLMNGSGETNGGSDFSTDHFWLVQNTSVAAGAMFARNGELMVWPGGLSAQGLGDRAADYFDQGIGALTGATAANFDDGELAWYLTTPAGTSPVSWVMKTAASRFASVFVLDGWNSATWTFMLGGTTVASNTSPKTALAYGFHDGSNNQLVLVYGGTIPAGAAGAAATFTVTP